MGHKSQRPQPTNRNGIWYLVRRVPKAFAHRDRRRFACLSTGIPVRDDPRAILARHRTLELDAQLQSYWRAPVTSTQISTSNITAIQRAQDLGLSVVTTDDALKLGMEELWQRFVRVLGEKFPASPQPDDGDLKTATRLVFGVTPTSEAAKHAKIKVSGMIEEYQRINATELAAKSPLQRRKWLGQRQTALDLFLGLIGEDCAIEALTIQHAHKLRAHWQQRVLSGTVTAASANREMRHVSGLYSTIRAFHQLDVKNPFSCLNIRGDGDGKRVAFDADFVREHFLAEGKFADVNEQARRIVYLIIETGLRLSEACALTKETIHLDAPIPYIEVAANGRSTKTKKSVRKIPLVGVALEAMRLQPNGFPRYYDNFSVASATINKALIELGLRPAGDRSTTLYSLRHTFVDRLKAVEAPRDIQEDLMGHTHMYGEGTSLEHRYRWLKKIAYTPPEAI